MDNVSQLSQYLRGKHIFLSGVTGFLGKLLLEKIIRTMPDVGSVSVLIRPGDNKSSAQRFAEEVLGSELFSRLRRDDPSHLARFCQEKIHVVPGDLMYDHLGLPADQFRALHQRINLIIHAAATVKFNEDLEKSLAVNALSLNNVAALSRKSDWSPVLHVSTCYVNGFHSGSISESHLGPAGKLPDYLAAKNPDGSYHVDALIRFLKGKIARAKETAVTPEQRSARLVRMGIKIAREFGWNDTYTFTKWIGEQLIAERMKGHSLTILRPSIICSTLSEPFPGWVEGIKVIDVLIMGYVLGKLKVFPIHRNATIDLIPGDIVANAVFVGLADMLRMPNRKTILHCASGTINPITVKRMTRCCLAALSGPHRDIYDIVAKPVPRHPPVWTTKVPLRTLMRLRFAVLTLQKTFGSLLGKSFQGRIARKAKALANAWNNLDVLSFYGRPDYLFETSRLMAIHAALEETDRDLFLVNPENLDWEQYLERHIGGLKQYVVRPVAETQVQPNRQRSERLVPVSS